MYCKVCTNMKIHWFFLFLYSVAFAFAFCSSNKYKRRCVQMCCCCRCCYCCSTGLCAHIIVTHREYLYFSYCCERADETSHTHGLCIFVLSIYFPFVAVALSSNSNKKTTRSYDDCWHTQICHPHRHHTTIYCFSFSIFSFLLLSLFHFEYHLKWLVRS